MDPIARSYLFVPGNRPDRFDKACSAGAHAVIVDLEDAVPPGKKAAARQAVAAWLNPGQPVFVRINGADTVWFSEDLELCQGPGISGVVLPKTGSVEDIQSLEQWLSPSSAVLPLIETAQGFWNALAIARLPRVKRLIFGPIDFQLDLGILGDRDELLYFQSQLVLVSRLAGIQPPVDGVSTAIEDAGRLRADATRARSLGFGGKLCIHPKQVPIVNACFVPRPEEIAWARRVVEADARSGGAPVSLDGQMVDRPVVLKAQRILMETQNAGDETEERER